MAVLELDEAHALKFAEAVQPDPRAAAQRRPRPARPVRRDRPHRPAAGHASPSRPRPASCSTSTTRSSRGSATGSPTACEVRYFGVDASIADRLPELQEQDVRFDDDFTAPGRRARRRAAQAPRRADLRGAVRRGAHRRPAGAAAARAGRDDQRDRGDDDGADAARRRRSTPSAAAAALRAVTPPFGRGEVVMVDGQPLELVLVKNPAGFTVALGTYGTDAGRHDGRHQRQLRRRSRRLLALRRELREPARARGRGDQRRARLRHGAAAAVRRRAVDAVEPDLDRALDRVPRRAPRRAQADLLHLHRDDGAAPRCSPRATTCPTSGRRRHDEQGRDPPRPPLPARDEHLRRPRQHPLPRRRGSAATATRPSSTSTTPAATFPETAHLVVGGGGQDSGQVRVEDDLEQHRRPAARPRCRRARRC